jgi:hypothetical protein
MATRNGTPADAEDKWQEYAEGQREFDEALAVYRDRLLDLWAVASAFFRAESEGKNYKRRPALSITLPAEGNPTARLSVVPRWIRKGRRRGGQLDPSVIYADLLVERHCIAGQVYRWVEVGLTLEADAVNCGWRSMQWGIDALRRLAATVDAFLASPQESFAQSADHCCICRRALTDGQSRARGIGPKCLRRGNLLRQLVEKILARRV